MQSTGHLITQILHPMHKSSLIIGILIFASFPLEPISSSGSTMHSFRALFTGQTLPQMKLHPSPLMHLSCSRTATRTMQESALGGFKTLISRKCSYMQILKIDKRSGWFEVVPDSFDDLWHLEKLIEKGDKVSGSADRKIKAIEQGTAAHKEKIFVELEVEKAVFHEATNQLRVQGIVVAAKPEELVPLKSHHTLEGEIGKKIKVQKKALKNFHVERLERAKAATGREKVLLAVMDDEAADLAFLKDTGLEKKAHIKAA